MYNCGKVGIGSVQQQKCPDGKGVKLNVVLVVDGEEKCVTCGQVKGSRKCCRSERPPLPQTCPSSRAVRSTSHLEKCKRDKFQQYGCSDYPPDYCGNRPPQSAPSAPYAYPCPDLRNNAVYGPCPLARVNSQTAACQTISHEECQTDPYTSLAPLPPPPPNLLPIRSQKSVCLKKNTKSAMCQTPYPAPAVPMSQTLIGENKMLSQTQGQNVSACPSVQSVAVGPLPQQVGCTSTTALVPPPAVADLQVQQPSRAPSVCPSVAAAAPVSVIALSQQIEIGPSKTASVKQIASYQGQVASKVPTSCPSLLPSACPSQAPTACPSQETLASSCPSLLLQSVCPSMPALIKSGMPSQAQIVLAESVAPSAVPSSQAVNMEPIPPMEVPSTITHYGKPMATLESVQELPEYEPEPEERVRPGDILNNFEAHVSRMKLNEKQSSHASANATIMDEQSNSNTRMMQESVHDFQQEVAKMEDDAVYDGDFEDYDYAAEEDDQVGFAETEEDEADNAVVEKTEMEKTFSDANVLTKSQSYNEFDRSRATNGVTQPLPYREVQSETALGSVNLVRSHIDFNLIRSESRMKLEQSLSQVMKPGLTGLKEFMSSRQLAKQASESQASIMDQPHLDKFIDYFIDCDGLRYLGILEQIELDYEDRCKAALLTAKHHTQHEAEYLRARLETEIIQIQPSSDQKNLKDFNFPGLLGSLIKALGINYKPKIVAIQRIHEYGLDMEEYWMCELSLGGRVTKTEIYDIGTQMLAELMGQLFSLLVKSCEFLMKVNEDVRKYKDKYTSSSLIHLFSEFRRLLVEEVGAVGETCGYVMIKIPHMSDDEIIDIMTQLYSQVNFVDICIAKALKTVVPLILLFAINRRTGPDDQVL